MSSLHEGREERKKLRFFDYGERRKNKGERRKEKERAQIKMLTHKNYS